MAEQAVLRVLDLPAEPLDAAARFFADIVPQVRKLNDVNVAIVLPHADYCHNAWRLAAIQELAREAAPHRVNAVAGNAKGVDELLAYLADAPGITGQILTLGAKTD